MLKEILSRLPDLEVFEPFVKVIFLSVLSLELFFGSFVRRLGGSFVLLRFQLFLAFSCFSIHNFLNLQNNLFMPFTQVLLQIDPLCNDVAFHGLLLQLKHLLNLFVICLPLHLSLDMQPTLADCVHVICFQQVVE
jgi:hypothetical protein